MAISWELTITPISIAEKIVSVLAVRTDDTDPDNPMAYQVAKAPINTAAEKLAVVDEIWAKHQAHLARTASISDLVSALEASGKTQLEAKE